MNFTPKARIQVTDTCPCCGGNKVVPNPAWHEFNEAVGNGTAKVEEMEKWFSERGLTTRRQAMGRSMEVLPSEEIPCGECEGEGSVTVFVSLAQLRDFFLSGKTF